MIGHRSLALVGCLLAFFLLTQEACASPQRAALPNTGSASSGSIELISKGSSGHGGGTYAAISGSGRYVAFESPALDLLPGVISGSWDTYLHDQQTGKLERDSTAAGGAPVYNPGAYTSPPAVSADGRFVAFMSQAEKLVANDGNNSPDIFVHDRQTDTTELISVALTGKSGNDASYTPAISADGRFVVFQSFASDLVKGDTNNSMDVFIRDRQAGTTELVSVTSSGAQGSDLHDYGFPGLSVSNDGRYVAFAYQNLPVSGSPTAGPNIYLRDRQARTTRWIASGTLPALSGDGRFLAFVTTSALNPDDTNGGADVYLLDLGASQSSRQFERVSIPNAVPETSGAEITDPPSLSADGRFIAFETTAGLVSNDTNRIADVYTRDRQAKTTSLISAAPDGSAGNGESHFPSISADGSQIAFTSMASNLVANDTNGQNDVFVYYRITPMAGSVNTMIYLPLIARP